MGWIVCALPICIFMALFTVRALGFEPVKFMGYTSEDYYKNKDKSLHIVLSRANYCLKVCYIVIAMVVGLILCAFLCHSHISILTTIGGVAVVAGIACIVSVVFILIEACLRKITMMSKI